MSPQAWILQITTAGWISQAVSAAATLGIADELGSGPRSAEQIAQAIDAEAPALYRLLRACSDIGIFRELEGRVFTLTDSGKALRSDAPGSMRNFAVWAGLPATRNTWTDLARSIQTGESAFPRVHGEPLFAYMRERSDVAAVFDKAMSEIAHQVLLPAVTAYDFSAFRTIVDVGGGQGAVLAAVLAASPRSHGVLYDLPDVIDGAGRLLDDEPGVRERTKLISGDFFESVPGGGDAYLLSNIIHDWDDASSVRILANCREATARDGRVLLLEAVLQEGHPSSLMMKLMDLDIFVLTGGMQRTEAEFSNLLRQAGLRLSRVIPGGFCSIVEAVRG